MADLGDDDLIPVRDQDNYMEHLASADAYLITEIRSEPVGERMMIGKLSRSDLEDRCLSLMDENIAMKKDLRQHEDNIKKMATKLLRLMRERKNGGVSYRDIDTEDYQIRIQELENQNSNLKDKMALLKQQLIALGRPKPAPSPSRGPRIRRHQGVTQNDPGPPPVALPRSAQLLLEEARRENLRLEDNIGMLRQQIEDYKQDLEYIKEEGQRKESQHEEEIRLLKGRVDHDNNKANIQENMELIRTQRELRQQGATVSSLQSQLSGNEESLRAARQANDHLLQEIERVTGLLRDEQAKNLSKEQELKATEAQLHPLKELHEKLNDLQKENNVLREANESLTLTAMQPRKSSPVPSAESQREVNLLKEQIAEIERNFQVELNSKLEIMEELTREKERYLELERKLSDSQVHHEELKARLSSTGQSGPLVMTTSSRDAPDGIDTDPKPKRDEELSKVKGLYLDSVTELDKTRTMLTVQHQICDDLKNELENVKEKLEEERERYEAKILELEMVAKKVPSTPAMLMTHAGQQIFEMRVGQVEYQQEFEGVNTFISWEFFSYGSHRTPVMEGARPNYHTAALYLLELEEFMHRVSKEKLRLEVYREDGGGGELLGYASLNLEDVLRSEGWSIASLHVMDAHVLNSNLGSLSCSYRFHDDISKPIQVISPMNQAAPVAKPRNKAQVLSSSLNIHPEVTPRKNRGDESQRRENHANHSDSSNNSSPRKPYTKDSDTFSKTSHLDLRGDTDVMRTPKKQLKMDQIELPVSSRIQYRSSLTTPLSARSQNEKSEGNESDNDGRISRPSSGHRKLEVGKYLEVEAMSPARSLPPPSARMRPKSSTPKSRNLPEMVYTIEDSPISSSRQDEEGRLEYRQSPYSTRSSKIDGKKHREISFSSPSVTVREDRDASSRLVPSLALSERPSEIDSGKMMGRPSSELDAAATGSASEDTYFEESEAETSSATGPDRPHQERSLTVADVHSSPGNMTSRTNTSIKRDEAQVFDDIIITVHSLTLSKTAKVLKDKNVGGIFVEYRFLDVPTEELETPQSLPKPKAGKALVFNFSKEIPMSGPQFADRRRYLAMMLGGASPAKGFLPFTVVSEPVDENQDCSDVGTAYLNVKQLLVTGKDIDEGELDLIGAIEKKVVGKLNVSFKGVEVMRVVKKDYLASQG